MAFIVLEGSESHNKLIIEDTDHEVYELLQEQQLGDNDNFLLEYGHRIILETYLSFLKTGFDYEVANDIKTHINKHFDLIKFSDSDISQVISLLKHDKKNSDDKPMFVLLENLGKPLINQAVTDVEINDAFKFYRD